MTIEKLERVMWRLRSKNKGKKVFTNLERQRAVMVEVGTDERTYYRCKRALKLLRWINVRDRGHTIILTDNDVTGDY